jgi:LysM repeat protein
MRPIITVTAVVLLHLCVIAVLVGVNGCRSTSGFEQSGDNAAFSGGARPAGTAAVTPAPALDRIPTPVPAKLAPLGPVGAGGKRTVLKGETLMSIAASEKVTRADLAKANNLTLNADLKPGQELTIPAAPKPATKAGTKTAPKAGAKTAPAAAKPAAPAAAPAPTFTPLKLVPLTGTKPAETAPAAPEKK